MLNTNAVSYSAKNCENGSSIRIFSTNLRFFFYREKNQDFIFFNTAAPILSERVCIEKSLKHQPKRLLKTGMKFYFHHISFLSCIIV